MLTALDALAVLAPMGLRLSASIPLIKMLLSTRL